MNRSNRFQFLAAMSSRSPVLSLSSLFLSLYNFKYYGMFTIFDLQFILQHRGGRSHGRGFSGIPHDSGKGPFVSGDSHLRSVRDSNLGLRQGTFSNQTSFQPPPYNQNQQFRQPPPPSNQNQQFRQPPPYNPNQHFRPPLSYNRNQRFRQPPPSFDQNQAVQPRPRPRPPKPLDYRNWEYTKEAVPPNSGNLFLFFEMLI